jgi:hypothetical protein
MRRCISTSLPSWRFREDQDKSVSHSAAMAVETIERAMKWVLLCSCLDLNLTGFAAIHCGLMSKGASENSCQPNLRTIIPIMAIWTRASAWEVLTS